MYIDTTATRVNCNLLCKMNIIPVEHAANLAKYKSNLTWPSVAKLLLQTEHRDVTICAKRYGSTHRNVMCYTLQQMSVTVSHH